MYPCRASPDLASHLFAAAIKCRHRPLLFLNFQPQPVPAVERVFESVREMQRESVDGVEQEADTGAKGQMLMQVSDFVAMANVIAQAHDETPDRE